MKYLSLVPILFLMCSRQPRDPVLAQVGNKIITREEFVLRAEFSPELGFKGADSERPAYLLDLLIDEKLAALEAENAGLDTSTAIRQLTGFIEEMALARELYGREVQDKVQLQQAEIDRAVLCQAQTRTVGYLVFDDEMLARRYQKTLSSGISFNEALRSLYGDAADTTINRREIKWGYNESAIEEAAFALQMGQVSPVIAVEGAFMVMVLEDVKSDPIVTAAAKAQRENLARRILRGRREATVSDKFIASFAIAKKLQFNKPLVRMAADFLAEQSRSRQTAAERSLPGERPLGAEVIDNARLALESQLGTPLITWSDGSLSLRQVLEKWQGYNFNVDQTTPESCRRSIVRGISLLARDALLSGEGRRRGYDQLNSVREDVRTWQDSYLCTALQQQLAGSNAAQKILWQPYLQQWRSRHPVRIDSAMLHGIELGTIPVLALRTGQYNARVAPPWANFQ